MAPKERSGRPLKPDLDEVGDWSGPDEDTTAQFWSGASLSRSDPKLREAIERLAASVGEDVFGDDLEARGRDEHTLPMENEGDEPTLAEAGTGPGEDTDARARDYLLNTLGTGPRAQAPPPPEPEPERARPARPLPEHLDERTDPGLGPVEEFTISIDPRVIAAATAPRSFEPEPEPEPPPLRAPAPPPALDTYDAGGLELPDDGEAPSPATMALMFDGLDTGPVPGGDRPPAPRPNAPDVRDDGVDDLPSGAIPSFAEPPPGVPMVAPAPPANPPTGPGRKVAVRRATPAPAVAPPPRPASRPTPPRKRPDPTPAPTPAPPHRRGSLEELLSLADAPPVGEETISGSMELLSVHDAPPEGEETIGSSLERVDALMALADAPPEGEHTLSADMLLLEEPSLSESLEPLRAVPMPQDFLTGPTPKASPAQPPPRTPPPRTPPPPTQPPAPARPAVHDLETRDLRDLAGPKTVPLDPAQVEAAMRASAASQQQRRVQQPTVSRAPRHQPQGTVSERMRRETYKPDATPPPDAGRVGSGQPRVATADDLGPEGGDAYGEPILAWAATLIGIILLGGIGMVLLVVLVAVL